MTNLMLRPSLAFGTTRKGVHPLVVSASGDTVSRQSASLLNNWDGWVRTSLGRSVAYRFPNILVNCEPQLGEVTAWA